MNHPARLLFATSIAALGVLSAAPKALADMNCPDFPSQAAAQQHLRSDPSDPDGLDRDRDGIACESNPAPYDKQPVDRSGSSAGSSSPQPTQPYTPPTSPKPTAPPA